MGTNRHLKVIPGATNGGPFGPPSVLWRDIALASVVLAIVLMGIAGGMFSPHLGAELQIPEAQQNQELGPPAQSQEAFVYFPSLHVNQAIEIGADIPMF